MLVEALAGVAPVIARGEVLQEIGDGEDEPRDEAAARQVVAAQENVDADHHRHGQEKAGADDEHHRMTVAGFDGAGQVGKVARDGGIAQERFGQGEDDQRGDAKDDDFPEGVIAAEVDDDGVDRVGAACADFDWARWKAEIEGKAGARVSMA